MLYILLFILLLSCNVTPLPPLLRPDLLSTAYPEEDIINKYVKTIVLKIQSGGA